jgi:hypothetical protein
MWILIILVLSKPPELMTYETTFDTVVQCTDELKVQSAKFESKYPGVPFKIGCYPHA